MILVDFLLDGLLDVDEGGVVTDDGSKNNSSSSSSNVHSSVSVNSTALLDC